MFPLLPPLPSRSAARPARTVLAGALLLAGCGSWPRYNHLDEPDVIENQDPRASVVIAWTPDSGSDAIVEEALFSAGSPKNNANPANLETVGTGALTPGSGRRASGSLDGVGWDSEETPDLLTGGACADTGVQLDEGGYWAGDVDFFVVEAEAGVLCARALMETPIGFDIVVMPLNECGLPEAPLRDAEDVAGMNLGGAADGMQVPLPGPGRYGVLLAGYHAEDPDGRYPYEIGISLVEDVGGSALCPYLPAEGHPGGSE